MSVAERLRSLQPTDLGVPGPTSLDMARAFRSVRADPLSFLGEVSARYGDLVSFPVPGPPALLLNDPDDVRHVLQTGARGWGKQTVQYAALARVTGPGLLASSEPDWIEHRRLATPAFHHERLEAVGHEVSAAARAAVEARLSGLPGLPGPSVVDVAELTHRIGLDAVGRALFSADLSTHARRLLDATSDAAGLVVKLGRSILPTASWTPTPTNLRLRLTRRRLDAICAELVAARRARTTGSSRTHGNDLLGLLLDSEMTDAAIRHELVTMVIAGHETVAGALAWTLMLLAEHQPAQDRVRAELTAHAGPVSLLGHRSTLPWTRAVVDESLRLFPPAWALSRRSLGPDVIGGREVPPGTLAIISPWLLHRRAGSWSDPEAFRPERFLGAGTERPEGYLPFGQGPRLCIGREFALGEMVVVLAELLRDHRLAVPPGWSRPAARAQVAVHPAGGMPLVVTRAPGASR